MPGPVGQYVQWQQQLAQRQDWVRVSSSNVWGVRYHAERLILEVGFQDKATGALGARYFYYGASRILFLQMINSPSKGKFVWQRLRGKFPYHRVG